MVHGSWPEFERNVKGGESSSSSSAVAKAMADEGQWQFAVGGLQFMAGVVTSSANYHLLFTIF